MAKTKDSPCPVCGKPVVKLRSWKLYCSAKCRLVAWAQRQIKP